MDVSPLIPWAYYLSSWSTPIGFGPGNRARVARVDVCVVLVHEDDSDHRALVATVAVGSPGVVSEEPMEGAGGLLTERPIRIKLTSTEVSVFR